MFEVSCRWIQQVNPTVGKSTARIHGNTTASYQVTQITAVNFCRAISQSEEGYSTIVVAVAALFLFRVERDDVGVTLLFLPAL